MAALLYKNLIVNRKLFLAVPPLILFSLWITKSATPGDPTFILLVAAALCYGVPIVGLDSDIRTGTLAYYRALPIRTKDYAGSHYLLGFTAAALGGGVLYLSQRYIGQVSPLLAIYDGLLVMLLPLLLIAITFPVYYRFTLGSLRRFTMIYSFLNSSIIIFGRLLFSQMREWIAIQKMAPRGFVLFAYLVPVLFLLSFALSVRILGQNTE